MSNTKPLGANQVLKTVFDEAKKTLNVSVEDSELPSGAATEAKQDTEISLLSDIENNTDGIEESLSSINSKANTTKATTSSISRVSASITSVQLLASTVARIAAYFFNESSSICYLKLGTTASMTSYTKRMEPGEFLILNLDPIYTARIDAIWVTANGAMQITELTP